MPNQTHMKTAVHSVSVSQAENICLAQPEIFKVSKQLKMKLNQTPIVIYVFWKREKPVLMFYVEMEEGCIFSLLCSYILFTKKNSI